MNVLFLNHSESDYGGAFLYNGLCNVFGARKVYDYPLKKSYHGETHHYSLPNITNGCTAPLPWMPAHPVAWGSDCSLDTACIRTQISKHFFSLVVLESCRYTVKQTYAQFADAIRESGTPVVLHDGEDYREVDEAFIADVKPTLFLKREVLAAAPLLDMRGEHRRLAYPFSCPKVAPLVSKEEFQQRTYKAAMLFGNTAQIRKDLVNAFRSCDYADDVYCAMNSDGEAKQTLLGWDAYNQMLTDSMIGVSARGFGWDTCRYWEIPTAAVLLTQPLNLRIPDPYVHEKTCFEFVSPQHAVQIVQSLTRYTPEHLYEVYCAGHAHTVAHHTNTARVGYMLSLLQQVAHA